MLTIDRVEKMDLVVAAIEKMQQQGYSEIKAELDGFEKPKSYKNATTGTELIPDFTAIKGGKTHIFELGIKTDKIQDLKSKWLFLNTISTMKGNVFIVLTMRGHMKFAETLLKELDIEVKMIRI